MHADDIADYYTHDVGDLPAQIETALKFAPEALSGYMGMRRFVWDPSDTSEARLSKKHVNLVFTVLDVATNNLAGATNHARAALDAGLTWNELMQSMVQLWIVCGFASSWGITGYKMIQDLDEEGYGPSEKSI